VSGGATVDGVPMLAHTVDCWDCDNRVALVPSRHHAPNATHHVFGMGHQYPRITSDDRAWIYRPQPGVVRTPEPTSQQPARQANTWGHTDTLHIAYWLVTHDPCHPQRSSLPRPCRLKPVEWAAGPCGGACGPRSLGLRRSVGFRRVGRGRRL